MWLTKQRMTEGPVFGSVDRFEGLGIFFDTYDNERAHVGLLCKHNGLCRMCVLSKKVIYYSVIHSPMLWP